MSGTPSSSSPAAEGPRLSPEDLERMARELRDAGDPDLKGGLTRRGSAEPSRRAALSAAIPAQVPVALPLRKVEIRGARPTAPEGASPAGGVQPDAALASVDSDAPPIVYSGASPTTLEHALDAARSAKRVSPCDATHVREPERDERTRSQAKLGVGAVVLAGVGILLFVAAQQRGEVVSETSPNSSADTSPAGAPNSDPRGAPSADSAGPGSASLAAASGDAPSSPEPTSRKPPSPNHAPPSNQAQPSSPAGRDPAPSPAAPPRPAPSPPRNPPATAAPSTSAPTATAPSGPVPPPPTPDSAPPTPKSIRIF